MTRGISAAASALAAAAALDRGSAEPRRVRNRCLRAGRSVRQHRGPGPPSGAFRTEDTNGITFPTSSQPVEGFSALDRTRHMRRR